MIKVAQQNVHRIQFYMKLSLKGILKIFTRLQWPTIPRAVPYQTGPGSCKFLIMFSINYFLVFWPTMRKAEMLQKKCHYGKCHQKVFTLCLLQASHFFPLKMSIFPKIGPFLLLFIPPKWIKKIIIFRYWVNFWKIRKIENL